MKTRDVINRYFQIIRVIALAGYREREIHSANTQGYNDMTMKQLNVFDELLEECSVDPVTGFVRNGCCETGTEDIGSHTICVQISQEFLEFSRFRGNDLSTPVPEYGFPGLKSGDRWCLCAARWQEALQYDRAPRVYLRATHKRALAIVSLDDLKLFALDLE